MPYCCQCGNAVRNADVYCAKCGARQSAAAPPPPLPDYLAGVSSRTASLLCYVPMVGWLAAIVVLASARFRYDSKVRFNAFQGIYLFVAWLIVHSLGPVFGFPHFWGGLHFYSFVPWVLKVAVFCAWIFMIIKASQDELFKLPILGDLAEKSMSEQR